MNDYYAKDIGNKIRHGYREKQKEGLVVTPPFGYWKDHNTDLKKRLLAYAKEYPQLCQLTEDDEQGGLRFEIDKHRIGIRLTAPYSPERRIASSHRAKESGIITRNKAQG